MKISKTLGVTAIFAAILVSNNAQYLAIAEELDPSVDAHRI